MSKALIAFGGNLEDVLASFKYALGQLNTVGKVTARSKIYQTKAVGGPIGQPDYLNAVVALETDLNPQQLLKFLLKTEARCGRKRRIKWGPRTLDLDILDYNGQILETKDLTLPHPRMWERAFVLIPLSDVAPDYTSPVVNQSLKTRLGTINKSGVKTSDLSL